MSSSITEQISPTTKLICSISDLEFFLDSDTCRKITEFILNLNTSVQGKAGKEYAAESVSKTVQNIVNLIEIIFKYIEDIPPVPSPSRFGNKGFCTFLERVEQNIDSLLSNIIPNDKQYAIPEIGTYFLNSMGDRQRIDYGSGHELNFVMWLYCLQQLGELSGSDYSSLVLVVFQKYLSLMRKLQSQYWLEPAGSHGVWGLDDYHFLPFLWGSSQLIDHKHIRPKSICKVETVEAYADQYMYLGCIRFINQVKTGSFFEHSPLLYDISGAKSWSKVNEGMVKMFKAEVLGKLPIMKHFLFGSLIPLQLNSSTLSVHDHCEHSHPQSSPQFRVNSCCVQRIPSAIAARELENKK